MFIQMIAIAVIWESSIKGAALQYFVDVAKLSIERGFLVLRMYI